MSGLELFLVETLQESIIGSVRRKLIQLGTILILTFCVWGHVSEIFDHWDNTFRTGYDIEYSTVIVVLITGAVIAFARVTALIVRRFFANASLLAWSVTFVLTPRNACAFRGHSPPLPLRI